MEDYTIVTIYFNGQFWVACIQKSINGKLWEGYYTFGAEPTNPQILYFTSQLLPFIKLLKVERLTTIRLSVKEKITHLSAKDSYKEALTLELEKRKQEKREVKKLDREEKYKQKQLTKKETKRH